MTLAQPRWISPATFSCPNRVTFEERIAALEKLLGRSHFAVRVTELCAGCGLELDNWQEFVLEGALDRTDTWVSVVALILPRQNGKSVVLAARELGGLVERQETILHSASRSDSAHEAFLVLRGLLEKNEQTRTLVKRIVDRSGREEIELTTGGRILFRSRKSGMGRSLAADLLVIDDAQRVTEKWYDDARPILADSRDSQVWFAGTAGDQLSNPDGLVLARIRERGRRWDPQVAYFEWAAAESMSEVDDALAADPDVWARANPALGTRISPKVIEHELARLNFRSFCVERLGVGDWPPTGSAS